MKKRKYLANTFSLVFPAVFFVYIINKINFRELYSVLNNLSLKWYFFGFAVFSLHQIMITLKFSVLMPGRKMNLFQLFQIQALYIFMNYILPFKTGEFSYLFFLKKYSKASMAEGVTSLFVSRVLDVLTLILFWVALYSVRDKVFVNIPTFQNPVKLLFLILFAIVVVMFFLIGILPKFLERKKKESHVFRSFLLRLVEGFKAVHNVRSYMLILLLSGLMYMCIFWSFGIIVRSVGYSVGIWQAIAISLFALLGRIVQGVGNFGSHEAAWTGALLLIGFPQKEALLIALSSHFIIITYILFWAAFSYMGLEVFFKNKMETQP